MKCRRSLLWLLGLLSGCAVLSESGRDGAVTAGELETVQALYAYEDRLRRIGNPAWISERIARIRRYEPALQGCRDPWETLELVLLLSVSGAEPDRARALLESCLAKNPGPLLGGYIRARLDTLDRTERLQTELRTAQQALQRQQEELVRLRSRIKALAEQNREVPALRNTMEILKNQNQTLKQQIEALTTIEQNFMNRKLEQ